MKRILPFLLALLHIPFQTTAIPTTWTGGGGDGQWHNFLNWSTLSVPTALDAVTILLPEIVTIDAPASALSVSVFGDAKLIVGSTLSFTALLTVDDDAEMEWKSGTITGLGPIVIDGKMKVKDAIPKILAGGFGMEINGELHVDNSTGFSINSGGTVDNNGLIIFNDSGDLLLNSGGDFNNNGFLTFASDDANIIGVGTLDNNHVISKIDGSGENELSIFVDNTGSTIEVQEGKIKLKSGGTLDNSFYVISAGASVELDGGTTYELNGNLTASPSGTFKLNDATLAVPVNGTLNFNGTLFQWSDGDLNGGGILNSPACLLFAGNDQKRLVGPTTLNNSGCMTVTNDGDILMINDAKINNTGTFEFATDNCNILKSGNGSLFINSDTLRKTGGIGTNTIFVELQNNDGVIQGQTGNLLFDGGGMLQDGIYTALFGARVEFNAGTFVPLGELTGIPLGTVGLSAIFDVNSNATLDFNGTGFQWFSDIISGGDTLFNTGLLAVVSPVNKFLQGGTTLHNSGLMTLEGGGEFVGCAHAFVHNTGTIRFLDDDTDFLRSCSTFNPVRITNTGVIEKTSGAGESEINISLDNIHGKLEAHTGSIRVVRGSNLVGGEYLARAGAELHFDAGTYVLSDTLIGNVGGTLRFSTTFTVPDSSVIHFRGSGLQWSSGAINGNGRLTNLGLFSLTGTAQKTIGSNTSFVNDSLFIHGGGGNLIYGGQFTTICNNGTYDFRDGSDIGSGSGTLGKVFNNYGLVTKSNNTSESFTSGPIQFNNYHGQIIVDTGQLTFNGVGVLVGGQYFADELGTLEFDGVHTISDTLRGNPAGTIQLVDLFLVPDSAVIHFTGTGLQWPLGTIGGNGRLTNLGILHLTGTAAKGIGSNTTINNDSLFIHSGGGNLIYSGQYTTIANYGTYEFRDGSDIGSGSGTLGKLFNNYGLVLKSNSSSESFTSGPIQFSNYHGLIQVDTGKLRFAGVGDLVGGEYFADIPGELNFDGIHNLSDTLHGHAAGIISLTDRFDIPDSAAIHFTGNGLEWRSGNLSAGGKIHNLGLLHLTSTADKAICGGTDLQNDSLIIQSDGGSLVYCSDHIQIVNHGTYDLRDDSDMINGSGTQGKIFDNYGVFKKSTGNDVSSLNLNIQFSNLDGIVQVDSGRLWILGVGILEDGWYDAAVDAILDLDGVHTLHGTVPGSPDGIVRLSNTFRVIDTAAIHFTNQGLQWNEGAITGGGLLNNLGLLHLTGTAQKTLSGQSTIRNDSLIRHSDGGAFIYFNDFVEVHNYGTYELEDDSDISTSFGTQGKLFENYGLFHKSTGTGLSTTATVIQFSNYDGTVRADSGHLKFNGNGILEHGNYFVDSLATLQFNGHHTLSGPISSSPAGIMKFSNVINVTDTVCINFDQAGVQWSDGAVLGGGVLINSGALHLTEINDKTISGQTKIINDSLMTHSAGANLVFFELNIILDNHGVFEIYDDSDIISSFNTIGKLFNNYGTLRKVSGVGLSTISSPVLFHNYHGSIQVCAGQLKITGGRTLQGGNHLVKPGAQLWFDGDIVLSGEVNVLK